MPQYEPMNLVSAPILVAAAAGGAGVAAWAAMSPSSQLFGPTIRRTGIDGAIALTFDDGPNPAVTPRLLDLLDRYRAQATFFLIGRYARAVPQLAREIAGRGHLLANHTETHPSLTFLSPRRIREELTRCSEAIAVATGKTPAWMRPPFGFRGPQLHAVVRACDFSGVVMWSAWARDWKPQPAARVIKRLRRVAAGEIILLHDGDHRVPQGDRAHTVAALEFWLPRWRDAGLRFVSVNEIAGAPSAVPT